MKFFQKRGVAVTVMLLAIAASVAWGIYKKPASLPNVRYETWIYDGAGLLSAQTERAIDRYNDSWDSSYRALCAVATVKSVKGWDLDEYTAALGERWGLGSRDLLLVLVDAPDGPTWYMNGGNDIMGSLSVNYENELSSELDATVYSERWDDAAVQAFETIDRMYAGCYGGIGGYSGYYGEDDSGWQESSGTLSTLVKFLLVVLAVIVIWVIIDRLRYNRYRRRYLAPGMGTPTVRYMPIFWGRSLYSAPRVSTSAHRPSGVSHGVSHGTTQHRPSSAPHSSSSSRPSSGGFGSHGGFGGGSRGGSSRSSGSISRSSPSRSGGGFTRSGGSSRPSSGGFGSRGGFGGGSRGGFGKR